MLSGICTFITTTLFGNKIESMEGPVAEPEYYNDPLAGFSPAVRDALAGLRPRRGVAYHRSVHTYVAPPVSVRPSTLISVACCVTECAICQEVGAGAASRINACGHVYHTACLSPWLLNHTTCPMCRASV